MFIKKDTNVQYIASKPKKIAGLIEKRVFKVVNSEDVQSNTQIFNSCFVNKINNLDIDNAYEKSHFVIQAYNNKVKNLVQMLLSTI